MEEIKTVLGNISSNEVGVVLPHEHIYCYSDYLYEMGGSKYLDKEKVFGYAIERFKMLKEKHNLKTFIDCTPINIGRDIQMLKRISESIGINIICSTGFYYTEESLLYNMAAETLCEYIINDALNTNAGIIKCAVIELTPYSEKILRATAKAQLKLGLPIIMHTTVDRRNGVQALEIILSEGVKPQAVTVGHLSDTDDCEYIKSIAKYGCYIALDRFYEICNKDYITQKVDVITKLCSEGFEDKILLSHDALFFSGFSGNPEINPFPRFNYLFENILPELTEALSRKVTIENPLNMLKCI